MRLRDLFWLSINDLKRLGKRNAGPVIIMITAVIMFNLTSGFFVGIIRGFGVTVTENENLNFLHLEMYNDINVSRNDIEDILEIDGVVTVFPELTILATVESDDKSESLMLLGIPDEALPWFTDTELTSNNQILINERFTDYSIGETVSLGYTVMVGANQGIRKYMEISVAGYYPAPDILHFHPDTSLAPIDLIWTILAEFESVSVNTIQEHFEPSAYIVITDDINEIEYIAVTLENMGFRTSYTLKAAKGIPMLAKMVGIAGAIVIILLVFFACISVRAVISQTLRERLQEIGIMKALGFTAGDIRSVYLVQLFLAALVGYILSMFLSLLLISGINSFLAGNEVLSTYYVRLSPYNWLISLLISILVPTGSANRSITRYALMPAINMLRSK